MMRLVGSEAVRDRSRLSAVDAGVSEARAPVAASDPRWILAAQASSRLGNGGMLTPEDRDVLVRRAASLGLAPFDAHLVIAIVQDAGRRGETGLGSVQAERLAMVGSAKRRPPPGITTSTLWVLGLATVLFWLMVFWLTGAVRI